MHPKIGQHIWWKNYRVIYEGVWGYKVCSAYMGGNWGDILLSTIFTAGETRREVLTTSLWCSVRGGCEGMAYSSVWNHHWDGDQTLEQTSQGNGHGPKCVGVGEGFGQCSERDCVTFRLPCVKKDLWFHEKKKCFLFSVKAL